MDRYRAMSDTGKVALFQFKEEYPFGLAWGIGSRPVLERLMSSVSRSMVTHGVSQWRTVSANVNRTRRGQRG